MPNKVSLVKQKSVNSKLKNKQNKASRISVSLPFFLAKVEQQYVGR